MSTENVAASGFGADAGSRGNRVLSALASTGTIFVLLLILWVWIAILNPTFASRARSWPTSSVRRRS